MNFPTSIIQITSAIFALYVIHDLPVYTAKDIPNENKLSKWAYIIFWYLGFWGMALIQGYAPSKHNILLTISGLMFFHTSTIFFFAASCFPWGKKLYGYLYAILVSLWWASFLCYPEIINCPAGYWGVFVFITTFLHIKKQLKKSVVIYSDM